MMRAKTWVFGMVFVLLALVVACDQPDTAPPPPPTVQEASYDDATQILALTLSDGSIIEADLGSLVTHAELPDTPAPVTISATAFDANDQMLTLTLSDGSTLRTDLGALVTNQELPPSLHTSSYDADSGELVFTLSDGSAVRADLSDLTSSEQLEALLLVFLQAVEEALADSRISATTPVATPIRPLMEIVTLPPSVTGATPYPTAVPAVTLPPSVTSATPVATPVPVVTLPPSVTSATPVSTLPPSITSQGILDVGMSGLGPHVATLYDGGVLQNKFAALTTHETLFAMGYDGEWEPRLIRSFDISPDGLTYTLNLQQGAMWHTNHGDWGDFNASDLIWSIGEIVREGSSHSQAGNTRKVFACEGCELTKIDAITVELTRPRPTFQLTWFSQAPIPSFSMNSKKHFDAVGSEAARYQPVGTGPWMMVEYQTNVISGMRAVEDHWRTTPEFAEMIWWDIPEESTRLANFLVGHLDTGIFNPDSIQAIVDNSGQIPGLKFVVFPGATIQMLWHEGGHYAPDSPHHLPNAGGKVTIPIDEFYGDYRNICDDSDIVNGVATTMSSGDRRPWVSCDRDVDSAEWERAHKVREAMLRAIDRNSLINNVAFGEGEPWYIGIWANRGWMQQLGFDRLGRGDMDYDPVAARQLFAEAGYPDGFDVSVNKRLGTGTLLVVKDAVATDWLEIGLDVTLHNQQPAAYRVNSRARKTTDIYGSNDAPSFPEPLRAYTDFYRSASLDTYGVNHPELDRLIDLAGSTLDTDERWRIQGEIARFIYDNVLSMPLYAGNAVWPLGPEVDSWQAAPAGLDWLSYWEDARRRR